MAATPPTDRIARLQAFAAEAIAPHAQAWDLAGAMPESAIQQMAATGLLGLTIPGEYGGGGASQTELATITAVIGAACSSARSLMTVHLSLVAETIARWGTSAQKTYWLPRLATGQTIAAFALSEPEVGSDAAKVQCSYSPVEGGYHLSGTKKWTTFGSRADLLLVIARAAGDSPQAPITAFLVPTDSPGLLRKPIEGMIGTRASLIAEIQLQDCFVPADAVLGKPGWGFMQIVNTALDNGRFSVACGAVGVISACLEASAAYANQRMAFGKKIAEHALVRRKLAQMATDLSAARALVHEAARLRDARAHEAILASTTAKYFAAKAAAAAAHEAVQIHGAAGLHPDAPVQRYWRDARVLEIIEGTNELLELLIGEEAAKNPRQF